MDPKLVKTIAVGGVLVVAGVVLAASAIATSRRRKALAELAARMGWRFDPDPMPHAPDFPLFARGRRRTRRNVLSGRVEDIRVEIYDYHYTTGSGRNSRTHRQTVVDLRVPGLASPAFALRPEHLGHRIAAVFGHDDVDLPDRPEFSRRWHVAGADPERIRPFLDDDALVAFLQARDQVDLQANGERMLIFRAGRRLAPGEIETALGRAIETVLAFSARALGESG